MLNKSHCLVPHCFSKEARRCLLLRTRLVVHPQRGAVFQAMKIPIMDLLHAANMNLGIRSAGFLDALAPSAGYLRPCMKASQEPSELNQKHCRFARTCLSLEICRRSPHGDMPSPVAPHAPCKS